MEIKCIIIEDEPLAMQKMEAFIAKTPHLTCLAGFDNALEAIAFLQSQAVDLVFLDIQMEEFTGIQFLETVKSPPRIVITTAYEQYAVKGYEFEVDDYLLKPYTFQRFLQAVERVGKRLSEQSEAAPALIFLKTEHRLERVLLDEILYVEGMGEYLGVVTPKGRTMTLQNFKSMEVALGDARFCRVHKSYLVALDKIDSVERKHILIGDKRIPIGDTYRKSFFLKIGINR